MGTPLAERVYELRRERRHGASYMARRALDAVVAVAEEAEARSGEELFEQVLAAARGLAHARPEVGAVAGALGRVLAAARTNVHLDPDALRRLIAEEASSLVAARDRAAASIAIQLRGRLADGLVLTHSASATVREALLHTPPGRVTCTVSVPNEEGRRFAEELEEAGLDVELVADDEAADALDAVSLLLVGADTVFRDGALYNKIGTRALADEAERRGVPMVVAAEVIKLAPVDAGGAPALEPEASALFDLTPGERVDEVVTEEGTFRGPDVAALVDRIPFLGAGYALVRGDA